MSKIQCFNCVSKCAAANNLDPLQVEIMENNSVQVHFKKGEIIFKQNAFSLNVAFLKKGLVKVHMHGPVGEKILRLVKAPAYLGLPTSIGDKINQYSATALEETTVCFIDTQLFRNFIFKNGVFAYEIIVELCRNELNDYHRYVSQSQKQVPGLVAETILCMADKIFESNAFTIPLSRSELGDLIGTTRESVSRVLTEFSDAGIISINTKEIQILKRDLLEQIMEKG